MRCINVLNARMMLRRSQLAPPRHRLMPPLLRWWNLHPPAGHHIQSLQEVLCLRHSTHWLQYMCSLQHVCHLCDSISSWTSSDIKYSCPLVPMEIESIVPAQTSKPGCGSDLTGSLPIKTFVHCFGGALGPLSPSIHHPLSLNSSEENAALLFRFYFP
jgi:hypothetical protein